MCSGFVQCGVARVLQMSFEIFCAVDVDQLPVEKKLDVGRVYVDGLMELLRARVASYQRYLSENHEGLYGLLISPAWRAR